MIKRGGSYVVDSDFLIPECSGRRGQRLLELGTLRGLQGSVHGVPFDLAIICKGCLWLPRLAGSQNISVVNLLRDLVSSALAAATLDAVP